MKEKNNKGSQKDIKGVNTNGFCNVKYKYKLKTKNFIGAFFYATIIFGAICNFFGICLAIIRSGV